MVLRWFQLPLLLWLLLLRIRYPYVTLVCPELPRLLYCQKLISFFLCGTVNNFVFYSLPRQMLSVPLCLSEIPTLRAILMTTAPARLDSAAVAMWPRIGRQFQWNPQVDWAAMSQCDPIAGAAHLQVAARQNSGHDGGCLAKLERATWWMCPATLPSWRTPVVFRPTSSLTHCVMLSRAVWYIVVGIGISEVPTASVCWREELSDCPIRKTCWYSTSRQHCVDCWLQCPFLLPV
jgi:hypothetical protein